MLPTIKQIREANGGLDNLTDFEIAQYQHQKYARYVPDFNRFAQLVGVDPGSKWGNRLSASIDNYQANMAGVAEAVTGSETMRDVRLSNQRDARNAQQFAQNQGAVMSYKDVDGVGDALDYVGGLAVDSAPYIAESLVGGLAVRGLSTGLRGTIAAGRAADASADAIRAGQAASKALASRATLGGVAASYPSAVGDILQSQRDETGTTDLGMAAMGGVPYAALNAVGLEGAAARGTLPRAGLDLLNRGLDGAQGVKGVVARTGANALKAAVPEGLSETGQEMINQSFGRMAVNPDQTLFNPEANERYLESFVGGAALGGAFGGAAGGWRRSEGYQAPVAPIDETGGVNLLTGERLGQPARDLQLGYDPTAGNDRLITFPDGTTAFPEDVPERRAQLAAQDHPGFVERAAEYPEVPLVSLEQAAIEEDKAKIEARNAVREEAKGLGITGSKGTDLYLELKQALDDGVISEAAFREARVQLGERKNNQVARFVKAAYAVDEAAKAGKAQLEANAAAAVQAKAGAQAAPEVDLATAEQAWESARERLRTLPDAVRNSIPVMPVFGDLTPEQKTQVADLAAKDQFTLAAADTVLNPPKKTAGPAPHPKSEEEYEFRRSLGQHLLDLRKDGASEKDKAMLEILQDWMGVDVDANGELTPREHTLSQAQIGKLLTNSKSGKTGVTRQGVHKAIKATLEAIGAPKGTNADRLRQLLGFQLSGTDLETINRNATATTKPEDGTDSMDGAFDGAFDQFDPETGVEIEKAAPRSLEDDVGDGETEGYEVDLEDAIRQVREAERIQNAKTGLEKVLDEDLVSGAVLESDIAEAKFAFENMGTRKKWENLSTYEQATAVRYYANARESGDPSVTENQREFNEAQKSGNATAQPDAGAGTDARQGVRGAGGKAQGEPRSAEAGDGGNTTAEQPLEEAQRPASQAPVVIVKKKRAIQRPQMSVAEGGSSTEASIMEEIKTLMPVNRQKVVVVQSVSQLPRFAQQSLAEEGPQGKKVQAFVLNGKAYLIADNIRPGSARSVFLHEVGVHMGLEDLLSGKEFLRLAGKIRSWADSNDGSRESELAKRAVNRVGNAGTQDEQVLSELVAYFVEEAVSAGVNPTAMDYKSDLGRWMQSLISALKAGLAKLGLVDAKGLTAQDVVDMAYGAAQLEMQSDTRADDGSGSFQASVATQLGPQYAKAESGVKQAMADLKTAAVKYGAFTRDLIDQTAKYMPAASDYLKKYEAVAIDRTKMEQQVDAVLERFSELNAAERAQVNSLIRSSTMDKVWAFKPEWLTDAQAGFDRQSSQAAAFAAMTPAQQAVVRDVFKHGYDTLKQMQDAVTNNVNSEFDALIKGFRDAGNEAEAVKAEGRKKQALQEFRTMLAMNGNWPYAPLRRFGDHVVVAKSAAYLEAERQGDRKAISEMEADENHYYVEFFESRREARAAVADMQSRGRYPGGTVENFNKGDASDQLYGGRDTFNAFRRLRNLVNESGSTMDAAANAAINKLMNDLYLTLLGERSARQAERNRKNTAGADRDMMRAFATKGRADAHFIAALRNGGEVQELLVEMKKQADQGTSGTRELRREFFNEILARHTMAMDFQSTPVVDKVMAFTSFFQLMVNPAYYLQNVMQPWVMTLPMLAGKFGYARAWREMSRAYRDLAPLLKDGRFTKGDYDALPADVREVVKQLAARGRIEISLEHDLGAWRSNDAGNVASRTLSTVESKLRKANQTVEMVNRLATAITAARLEPAASAVDYADRVIIATHGDYNAFNAPRLTRTRLGRLATQFRKFQLIQITMYTKLIADAFNGASADERAVARRILAFNLGHMAGLAGAVGLPGFQFFSMVLGAAFGDDDEPDDPEATMRRILGNGPVADALIRGVPNMMGVDLSGKVGSGNMLSLFPYADWDFTSRDGYSKLVLAALGPFIGGMVPRWAEGLGHMQDGDYYKGLEKFLPGALGNAIKGARLSTEGVTTTRGDLVMGPEEVSWVDGLFQAAGLPTKTLTERSFLASAEFKASRFFNERSSEIKRAYVEAFEDNDAAALEQARRDWQDMQATRKRLGLAPQPMSQLIRAPMEKRRREAAAVGGVAADKQTEGFVRNLME